MFTARQFYAAFSAMVKFAVVLFAFAASARDKSESVDFNFQVRPILSDRCFKCHGPDEKSRKAGLRLDTAEGAFAVCDKKTGARAIVPNHPEKSEVIHRITSHDPDEMMPPLGSHLEIHSDEVATIRRWIGQGAVYKSHWSFLPVRKRHVPTIKSPWAQNPIDRFVLQRLQREKLSPAPEADRETLIRRLSFDLTGLPPRWSDVDAFAHDGATNAYEKVVDRLLASPAYGERMANEWLDLARYADTYGYQSDVDRDMSPWRDWVIRAFNRNMPYDQFATWQIAGDLLPNATDEQILATAFNRLHRQTNEGGSIEEEFRTEYCADRVQTFGTTFLGVTLECCRCHDHKYDPIKQRDYYSIMAFFNNIDESGLYSHFTHATPSPTLLLYAPGMKEKHASLKTKIAAEEKNLSAIAARHGDGLKDWLRMVRVQDLKPKPVATFSFETVTNNQTPNVAGAGTVSFSENPIQVDGRIGKAMKFSGENSVICKGFGQFKRTDPFSFSLWLQPTEKQERAVVFHRSRSWTDSGSRGYELLLENGRPSFALVHFWPGNAIRIRARDALPLNQWSHLTIAYDGSSRAAGLQLYLNGAPLAADVIRDNLFKDILHRHEWGDADVENIDLTLAARFRDSGFKNGLIDEFQVFNACLTPLEVRLNAGHDQAPNAKELSQLFVARCDPDYQRALANLKKLRDEENDLVNDFPEIMVMKEMKERRPTFVLKRGSYASPSDPVNPNTPERIFPFSPKLPKNRLGLAKWLVDRDNPLTARVEVNRLWKMHFGRGLVATMNDFGSQGQLPTYPELLDWLASEFMASRWDIKAMHKRIVMSATYRQSSTASEELIASDPDNRSLARGPKHRLDAEQIRDSALAVSWLLSSKIGGPSVKPYQPAGLWEQSGIAKTYQQDKGEKLYRRSLYTFWRRTAPPPSMITFDATSREICTAKREVTTTPLQALVLLNDPQFVEASRVVAEKVLTDSGAEDVSVEKAFEYVLGREPVAQETTILRKLYDEQLELFAASPDEAKKYLSVGEHALSKTITLPKLAAMTVLTSTLMNHDEFIMER